MPGFGFGGFGTSESYSSTYYAGPVSERSLGEFDFQVDALSEGYKIRIRYSAPSVADAPDWARRLRILRKQGEWPQSWDDPDAQVVIDDTYPGAGSYELVQSGLPEGQIYYYALYEHRNDGAWIHDWIDGRGSAYAYDRWGAAEYMFDSMPRGWKSDDVDTGDLLAFLTIFGALVDDIKTDCEHLLTLFEIDTVHADLIPLLDMEIAWPTWYATGALQQRKETSEAVDLYKILGRPAAYEQMLEEISNWETTLIEGWRYVMFSNGLYGSTTPDTTDPNLIPNVGRLADILKYTNDGEGWHALHGLVIVMTEISGISGPLNAEMLSRYRFLIEWGKASFVTTHLILVTVEEELVLVPLEEWWDPVISFSEGMGAPSDEFLIATTTDAGLFLSNTLTSTTNSSDDRTWHEALEYV